MSDDTPPSAATRERRGWSWALIKCLITTFVSTLLGAFGLWAVVRWAELPWYIPKAIYDWLMENVAPLAPYIGGAVGLLVGLALSVLIVVVDAMRGKLSRVP